MNNSGSTPLPQYLPNLELGSQPIQPEVNTTGGTSVQEHVQDLHKDQTRVKTPDILSIEDINKVVWYANELKNQARLRGMEKPDTGHGTQPFQPQVNITTGGMQPIQPQVNPYNATSIAPGGVYGGIQQPYHDYRVPNTIPFQNYQKLPKNFTGFPQPQIYQNCGQIPGYVPRPDTNTAYGAFCAYLDANGINPNKHVLSEIDPRHLAFKMNALIIQAIVLAKDVDASKKALKVAKEQIEELKEDLAYKY